MIAHGKFHKRRTGRLERKIILSILMSMKHDLRDICFFYLNKLIYVPKRVTKRRKTTKEWLISVSFWIPRKYREAIVGDIMEDYHELRALGKSERRIRIHVIWQLVIALILLRSTSIMDAFKRIWSTK